MFTVIIITKEGEKRKMKNNNILTIITIFGMLTIFACNQTVNEVVEVNYDGVESAGKFFPGEENELNGNAYVLADDKYMDIVQQSTDAYNNRDWDAMKSLYTCLLYTSQSPRD